MVDAPTTPPTHALSVLRPTRRRASSLRLSPAGETLIPSAVGDLRVLVSDQVDHDLGLELRPDQTGVGARGGGDDLSAGGELARVARRVGDDVEVNRDGALTSGLSLVAGKDGRIVLAGRGGEGGRHAPGVTVSTCDRERPGSRRGAREIELPTDQEALAA